MKRPGKSLSSPIDFRGDVQDIERRDISIPTFGQVSGDGQQDLSRREDLLQLQIDRMPIASIVWDPQFRVTSWNSAAEKIFGFTAAEMLGNRPHGLILPEDASHFVEQLWARLLEGNETANSANENLTKDGRTIICDWSNTPLLDPDGRTIGVLSMAQDITERIRTEHALAAIYKISQDTVSTRSVDELYRSIHLNLADLMPVENFYISLYDPSRDMISFPYFVDQFDLPGPPVKAGRGLTEYVLRTGRPLLASPQVFHQLVREGEIELVGTDSVDWMGVPLKTEDRVIGVMVAQSYTEDIRYSLKDVELFEFVSIQIALAIERKRAEEKIQRDAFHARALVEVSQQIAGAGLDDRAILKAVTRSVSDFTGDACGMKLVSENGKLTLLESFFLASPEIAGMICDLLPSEAGHLGEGFICELQLSGEFDPFETVLPPVGCSFLSTENRSKLVEKGVDSILFVPLQAHGKWIGALGLARCVPERSYNNEDLIFMQEIADRTGLAIANAQLFSQVQRSLSKVQALRQIDIAITGSIDLRISLGTVLDQVISQLGVDATNALVLNPYTLTLDYVAGRGFLTSALKHTHLRLGEGYAGKAALESRMIHIPDLSADRQEMPASPLFKQEGFVTFYAMPLIAQGRVKGVLEIFHRSPLDPAPEWLDFLDALAGQAAIAIDNASLFHDLQHSNQELTLAYDATIEGWSSALDLRDRETEGHTQRVTELTLFLAREFGMGSEELVHVRRGALLHDIGKMGIPDHILRKNGPLTDEERLEINNHPVYAYNLLSPIAYLRPALDIPYCHHEKWDGTGYPRGLKGQDIPLVARIFAVVDVWDALCSDRPYRPAWEESRALEYIREQAGEHFDPQVVELFLKVKPWKKLLPGTLEEGEEQEFLASQ